MIAFIKTQFNVDFVDMITEPGPDIFLSENSEIKTMESIKARVGISCEKHGSKVIVIAGHHDCAGNPVDDNIHKDQIKESVKTVDQWGFDADVIGVWINQDFEVRRT